MSVLTGQVQSLINISGNFARIGFAFNIAGNTLATTVLTFVQGIGLGTHIPLFAVIKYRSGTLGISAVTLKANGVNISAAGVPLAGLTSGNWVMIPVAAGAIANNGNLSIQVATAGLTSSEFDIEVFGVKY